MIETDRPYIIENVEGAKSDMIAPLMLCGVMFGLKVYRHRLFEIDPWMLGPPHIKHERHSPRKRQGLPNGGGYLSVVGHAFPADYARAAMGIDWMTRDELAQAIPPTYTEYIGKQLRETLGL
jgi:DNA (cytosine-5)-methyltransferase 1